jgi:endonuclease-3
MAKPKVNSSSARETAAQRVARARRITAELHRLYGDAHCALDHGNAFQLLVATILSAQCTDERVNQVTPALFKAFPTPAAMANSKPGEIEALVRSTGFYNNKAKNIRGAARAIVDRFEGKVPRTMDELLQLPGVARKTANVVLGNAYGIAEGFVVDTHIARLARRFGFTRESTPEKIEIDLCKLLPRDEWVFLGHAIIWHGRRVCSARKPDCEHCTLAPWCPSKGKPAGAWKKRR